MPVASQLNTVCRFTGLPEVQAVITQKVSLLDGIFWAPQVIGGCGFIISSWVLSLFPHIGSLTPRLERYWCWRCNNNGICRSLWVWVGKLLVGVLYYGTFLRSLMWSDTSLELCWSNRFYGLRGTRLWGTTPFWYVLPELSFYVLGELGVFDWEYHAVVWERECCVMLWCAYHTFSN